MFLMPSGKGPRKRGGRNRGQGRNKDRPSGEYFPKTGRICEFGSRTRLLRLMAMAAMVAMVAIEAETGPDQWHEGRWWALLDVSAMPMTSYDLALYDSVFHVLEIPWPCDLLDELPDGSGMPGLCVSKHCRLGYFRLLDSWHHFTCFYSIQFVFSHHIFRCNCPKSGGHSWALRMWPAPLDLSISRPDTWFSSWIVVRLQHWGDWQDNEVWQNLAKHISHRFTWKI